MIMKIEPLNFLFWNKFSCSIISKIKKDIKVLSSEISSFLKLTASNKNLLDELLTESVVVQAEFNSITKCSRDNLSMFYSFLSQLHNANKYEIIQPK